MKNVRIVLPLLAIIFAAFSAFATGTKRKALDPVEVVLTQIACPVVGECTNDGVTPCQNEEEDRYLEKQTESSCSIPATGQFQN